MVSHYTATTTMVGPTIQPEGSILNGYRGSSFITRARGLTSFPAVAAEYLLNHAQTIAAERAPAQRGRKRRRRADEIGYDTPPQPLARSLETLLLSLRFD